MRVAAWACVLLLAALLYVTVRPRWEYRVEVFSELDWRLPAELAREGPSPADLGRGGWEIVEARWITSPRSGYECVLRRRVLP